LYWSKNITFTFAQIFDDWSKGKKRFTVTKGSIVIVGRSYDIFVTHNSVDRSLVRSVVIYTIASIVLVFERISPFTVCGFVVAAVFVYIIVTVTSVFVVVVNIDTIELVFFFIVFFFVVVPFHGDGVQVVAIVDVVFVVFEIIFVFGVAFVTFLITVAVFLIIHKLPNSTPTKSRVWVFVELGGEARPYCLFPVLFFLYFFKIFFNPFINLSNISLTVVFHKYKPNDVDQTLFRLFILHGVIATGTVVTVGITSVGNEGVDALAVLVVVIHIVQFVGKRSDAPYSPFAGRTRFFHELWASRKLGANRVSGSLLLCDIISKIFD